MKKKQQRNQYFVELDLQFWFVLILILIVSAEGIFVGYGLFRLLDIASDWQRTHLVMDFFKTLGIILFLLIGVNFILGIYLSHKIAGPIFGLRKALQEIKKGNLSHVIQIRRGDMLKDFVKEFNETITLLNKLVHRDRNLINHALARFDQCQEILARKHSVKELKEVQKIFVEIKSFLVTVNSHFILSPYTFQEEKNNDEKENSSDN